MKKYFYILFPILFLNFFIPFLADASAVVTWKIDSSKVEPQVIFKGEDISVSVTIRGDGFFLPSSGSGSCSSEKKCTMIKIDYGGSGGALPPASSACCLEVKGSMVDNRCVGSNFVSCDYNFGWSFKFAGNYKITVTGTSFQGGGAQNTISETVIGNVRVIEKPEKPNPIDKSKINPVGATKIEEFIDKASGSIYWIATGILVLVILAAGINILIAAGDPLKIQQGKNALFYALIGFALMAMSKGIIDLIRLVIGVKE